MHDHAAKGGCASAAACLYSFAGKIYALKQMSKAHIIDNKLVAHVHREKNVSGQHSWAGWHAGRSLLCKALLCDRVWAIPREQSMCAGHLIECLQWFHDPAHSHSKRDVWC
jgi:hypothetical protein